MNRISTYTKKVQFNDSRKAYVSEWDGLNLLSFTMDYSQGQVRANTDFTDIINNNVKEIDLTDFLKTKGIEGIETLNYSMYFRAIKRAFNIHKIQNSRELNA